MMKKFWKVFDIFMVALIVFTIFTLTIYEEVDIYVVYDELNGNLLAKILHFLYFASTDLINFFAATSVLFWPIPWGIYKVISFGDKKIEAELIKEKKKVSPTVEPQSISLIERDISRCD